MKNSRRRGKMKRSRSTRQDDGVTKKQIKAQQNQKPTIHMP